jgi:hypothetical protein
MSTGALEERGREEAQPFKIKPMLNAMPTKDKNFITKLLVNLSR